MELYQPPGISDDFYYGDINLISLIPSVKNYVD